MSPAHTMRALVLPEIHRAPEVQHVPVPRLKKGEKLVHLRAAALNHRDIWIVKGQYAAIQTPTILGSDGAGEVDGKTVVIYPAKAWGRSRVVPTAKFRVLGMPDAGTFAEYIAVEQKYIYAKPAHLNFWQAAALPLAGLTAWRVLFSRCQLKKGEKVLITGIGGGVALMALQWAVAAGAEVFVTSGSDEKCARAQQLGAKLGVNYHTEHWDKTLRQASGGSGFDVIVDSAGGEPFVRLVHLCAPGGRVGIYGGGLGKWGQLSPQHIFWKQISLLGSSMGSPVEFKKMLQFVEQQQIIPVVDSVFALDDAQLAFQKMETAQQFGKIVLNIP